MSGTAEIERNVPRRSRGGIPWISAVFIDYLGEREKNKWCPGEDSNLHVVRHTDLNRARLPIPPPGQSGCEGGVIGPLGRNVNGEIQQPNTQQPSVVRTNPALRTIRTMPPKSRRSRQSLLSAPSEHSDAAVAFRERCFQSCELGIAVQFCYPTFGPRSLLQLQCWSEQREIGITTVV